MNLSEKIKDKYIHLVNESPLPDQYEGFGTFMDQTEHPIAALAFNTRRDIITEIGVKIYGDQVPEDLKICFGCIIEYALNNSVMGAHTITPDHIASSLGLKELPESSFIYAVLAIYTLKDAISNFAGLHKEMVEEFKKQQN